MSRRHGQRQAADLAPQQPADLLALVAQRGERAAHVMQGVEDSPTSTFSGHADRGQVGGHTEVAAIPSRRGWAMPCPSMKHRSGSVDSSDRASSTAGSSRKLSRPGM
jgi:hypothetical protein